MDQMWRGSHIGVVDSKANSVGIIDNAVQPIFNIIGRGLSKGIMECWDTVISGGKHSILHKNMLTIVAEFIEEISEWAGLQIRDSIKPMFIIIKVMIKDGRIPVRVTSPDNMGKTVPFCISVRAHVDIREPIDNVDRKNISIKGGDALQSALDFDRMIIDIIAICLQL